MNKSSNGRKLLWLGISIWFVCALLYFFEFFVRASTNALSSYFDNDLGLTSVTISFVGSSFYLFYVIAQLPAGISIDRFGVKKVMIFATAVSLLGILIFTYAHQASGLMIGRALVGFGGGFAFISSLKVIANWLPSRLFPTFAGFTQLMGYFGGVASGIPLVMMLSKYGETRVFIGVSIFCAMLVLLSIVWVRTNKDHVETVSDKPKSKISETLIYIFTNKQLLLNGFYCLFLTGTTAVFADLWGINYLTTVYAMSRAEAASCISMVYLGVALSSPIWGIVASITNGSKRWLVAASAVGVAVVLILLYVQVSITMALILCFMFGSVQSVHVLNFHLVHTNVKREQLGASIALVNLFVPLSGFLFQPVSGYLIESFEKSSGSELVSYEKGLIMVPVLMVISLVIALFFKESSKEAKV